MDGTQILMLVLQLVLGGLLGIVVWVVLDMRGDLKRRVSSLETRVGAVELAIAGRYVLRSDCEARHGGVDAKLRNLDTARERLNVEIIRLGGKAE